MLKKLFVPGVVVAAAMFAYGGELIAEKRRCPGDDMLSIIANATIEGADGKAEPVAEPMPAPVDAAPTDSPAPDSSAADTPAPPPDLPPPFA